MPFVQAAYLTLVIGCFLAVAVVLAWGSWWSRGSRTVSEPAAKVRAPRKSGSRSNAGAGLTA